MLIYTFRTFELKDKLWEKNVNAFIFGKLKEDFVNFSEKILKEKPDFVIGIAQSQESKFESIAINKYNETKKVSLEGKDKFELYIPIDSIFEVAETKNDSFCNWSAYKISKFIEDHKLNTKLIFVNLNPKDLDKFLKYIVELE